MTNILTDSEAAGVLRCSATDSNMLALLPIVDSYIEGATGRNWAGDGTIDLKAKAAARLLLVQWFENPGMMGGDVGAAMGPGLRACLSQLEARALELAGAGVPDRALEILGFSPGLNAINVAITVSPVLIFSVEMADNAENAAALIDGAGAVVTTVRAFDVTNKILTINPASNLSSGARYVVRLTGIADVYGRTITDDLSFGTVTA